jgi:N6-L-threonylcarbamoyladenine synthase
MTLLAVETSCDETSAAIVRAGGLVANVVSSQIPLHAEYGGVVPELATREHLRNLLPVAQAALRQARVRPEELEGVAATRGPGLPNALLIGFKAGQAMAFALGKPFLGINHLEAHLYSPWVEPPEASENEAKEGLGPGRLAGRDRPTFRANFKAFEPNVSLIVSGGHTLLVLVRRELEHQVLGSTLDDAAGECFDKVGKMLGLAYPAGPRIDRLAERGNPAAHAFPRPMLNDPRDDFSFAGLKTSVRYFLQKHPAVLADTPAVCDVCASAQAAIVEVLVAKTVRAARREGVRCVTASGGVTCNRALRGALGAACAREGLRLRLAERALCTDNAGMIGVLAERKLLRGPADAGWDQEILPNWELI